MPPKSTQRRERTSQSLESFLTTYFSRPGMRPLSADHVAIIRQFQDIIVNGGKQAAGLPLSIASFICLEVAAVWAVATGRRRFVAMIGAENYAHVGGSRLCSLLHQSEHLLFDFDDVFSPSEPFRCPPYGGITFRNGSAIVAASISQSLRGIQRLTGDGTCVRPDLILCNQLQGRLNAIQPHICDQIEKTLTHTIAALGGPQVDIPIMLVTTPVTRGDFADRILNRKFYPGWRGTRFKMLYVPPSNSSLWEEYATLRRNFMLQHLGNVEQRCTDFYQANRAAMDKGAVVAWPELFTEPHEISGLQHAMNLKIDLGEMEFAATCQCEPIAAPQL